MLCQDNSEQNTAQFKHINAVTIQEENRNNELTGKTKHHPSFTLILRKQLPLCMNSLHMIGNDQIDYGLEGTDSGGNKQSSCRLDLPIKSKDFEFSRSWQIWIMDESNSTTDWNVKKQDSPVQTARQFWMTYSKLYDLFEVINLKNLMIFQNGIEPKWEDKSNVGGGRWYFDVSYCNRNESGRRECLLKCNYWTQCLETVLSGCLGSGLGDIVVGLILNFKPSKYRVSLWTRSCSDFNQMIQLGTNLRNRLNLRCQLKFELHSPVPCSEPTVLELN